jgi:hypothetical protein
MENSFVLIESHTEELSPKITRVPQTSFFGSAASLLPFAFMLQQSQLRHPGLHKPGITIHSLDGSQSSI